MKVASLLCAAALVVTTSAIADATPAKKGAKAQKPHAHRMVRQAQPPQDPSRAYWNDPSRQGFPSYSRDVR